MSDGGTQEEGRSGPMEWPVQAGRIPGQGKPPGQIREAMGSEVSSELAWTTLPRKASSQDTGARTANRHR